MINYFSVITQFRKLFLKKTIMYRDTIWKIMMNEPLLRISYHPHKKGGTPGIQ